MADRRKKSTSSARGGRLASAGRSGKTGGSGKSAGGRRGSSSASGSDTRQGSERGSTGRGGSARGSSSPATSSTRAGASRRAGFGDEQGTQVGRPTPQSRGGQATGGPSSQPVSQGLEGSVLDADEGVSRSGKRGTGAEAARGMHAVSGQRGGEPREGSGVRGGRRSNVTSAKRNTVTEPGSQPIVGRTTEHESGYGGKAGEPRLSSDQREPVERKEGADLH